MRPWRGRRSIPLREWMRRLRAADADTRVVARHMALSLLVKGGSLGVSLLTTPALIRYFGASEALGLWYTLLSVLLWVLHLDLGVGNGLRNRLACDLAANDRAGARRTLSAGFLSLLGMTLVLFPAGLLLLRILDLGRLFSVDSAVVSPETVKLSAAVMLAGMLVRYLFGGVTAAFYAVQLASVNHLAHMAGGVFELVFLWTAKPPNPDTGLLWLSVAYAVLSNLPTLWAGLWLFSGWGRLGDCRPSFGCLDREHVAGVLRIGGVFFLCQVASVVVANTNEFLISALFGTADTADYGICHRLGSILSMVISPMLTPVWSMFTRAAQLGDAAWLSKSYRRLRSLGALAVALQILLVAAWPLILRLWLGEDAPVGAEEPATMLAFAVSGAVTAYAGVLSTVSSGLSRLRCQLWGYTAGAVLKLGGVFLLAPLTGDWRVVVWCHALSLVPYCVAERVALDRLLGGGKHRRRRARE